MQALISNEINKPELVNALNIRPSTKLRAFATYGIYVNDNWRGRNFENISDNKEEYPEKGDKIKATVPVIAREGFMQLQKQTGWKQQEIAGTIKKGDVLEVLNVKLIKPYYVWIEFVKE